MENRVYCLYRVSTTQQLYFDGNNQADIPMQKRECHRFAEKMGWNIIFEAQEDGISGYKVRASERDKLQLIRNHAKEGKFDILLVFMFDRLGRIADETPLILEWFVRNGIRVWSTQEGEQRFDSHVDKLTNYIRFWQADGESIKTSMRTKSGLARLVEDGFYKGGTAPFGYSLERTDRLDKRKRKTLSLAINSEEASVVRLIYDKYADGRLGAMRLASFLNEHGIKTRAGKKWHPSSIQEILHNQTYIGVLRCGETHSPVLEHLRIIEDDVFQRVQDLFKERSRKKPTGIVKLEIHNDLLLSGMLYCGHCGARLVLSVSKKSRKKKDGECAEYKRIRYVCYGKTRRQTDCDGQTGYTAHLLEGEGDEAFRQILRDVKGTPDPAFIYHQYYRERDDNAVTLEQVEREFKRSRNKYEKLKDEVIKTLMNESAYTKESLSGLLDGAHGELVVAETALEVARKNAENSRRYLEYLESERSASATWAEVYDAADMYVKKQIISRFISCVVVKRGYEVDVKFNE